MTNAHSLETGSSRQKGCYSLGILILTTVLAGCTSGCVIVPIALPTPWFNADGTRTNVRKESIQQLKPGKDSIEDVMLRLGEPDEVGEDERELVYCSRKDVGVWAVMIVALGGGGAGTGGPFTRDEFMLLQFDKAGLFTNSIIERKWGGHMADSILVSRTAPSLNLEAHKFKPECGKASIYVNQESGFFRPGGLVTIILDGHIVGSLDPGTYQLLSVAPGEHVLKTSGKFENVAELKVKAEPGKDYFINVSFSVRRWSSSPSHIYFYWAGQREGRKDVAKSKRVEVREYK